VADLPYRLPDRLAQMVGRWRGEGVPRVRPIALRQSARALDNRSPRVVVVEPDTSLPTTVFIAPR
jgi:hypothetical protein